jgi:carboxyl-terminal processing protease
MEVNRRDRMRVWTPLFFSLVLILGMVLGFNLRDSLRSKRELNSVLRNDRLDELIDLIDQKYVDTVNNNKLYQDAIAGILKSLDPHTVYIPAEDLQGANDDLEGEFSGIGVEFAIMRDTIQVVSVLDDGPARRAGIEVGDQLIKVGDSVVAGNNITSEEIVELLRGKKESKVAVTVKHVPDGRVKHVNIKRDNIPIYSVEASLMLDATTGYIKINRFSATTYKEFSTALKKLKKQGIKQLIIDLRDNPGGYIEAATSIADDLLDDEKLIVYTKGLRSPKTEYKAGKDGLFEKGKLAVLVNEGSASASEILAGAIQDWDRGVVLGRRSFGKGLVQEQYDLPDGAAIRLTVAKYYTPSGRCIQRSFARGKDAYAADYEKRFENGTLTVQDTAAVTDTTPFYTSTHRVVYGGGGIKPDVFVPYDTALINSGIMGMLYSQEMKTAIWDYFIHNRGQLKFRNITDFAQSFETPEQITGNYFAMLTPATRKGVLKQLAKPVNDQYFKQHIKAQMARFLFKDNGYYAVSLKQDDVVNRALDVLNGDQYSGIINRK